MADNKNNNTIEMERLQEPLLGPQEPPEEIVPLEQEQATNDDDVVVIETKSNDDDCLEQQNDNEEGEPETSNTLSVSMFAHSLAWAPTTHCLAKMLIPVLILVTHYLFYKGQTVDMWQIKAQWELDTTYHAHTTEASLALQALKIPTKDEIIIPETDHSMLNVTYAFGIHELWRAKGMPGVFIPRVAALGLVLFSGLWPHLKLFMLLLTWYFAKHPIRRRRALASLSILGKWSLCDVLVICVMVGVLNLQCDVTSSDFLQGVQDNLPVLASILAGMYTKTDLCGKLLKFTCHKPSKLKHIIECQACQKTVEHFYDHPNSAKMILGGIKTGGGGRYRLSVAGLEGIYTFCGAVTLSILLSLIVDWYDHQDRKYHRRQSRQLLLQASNEEQTLEVAAPEVSGTLSVDGGEATVAAGASNTDPLRHRRSSRTRVQSVDAEDTTLQLQQLLLAENGDYRSDADRDFDRRILLDAQQRGNLVWTGVSSLTAVAVFMAVLSITMERRVHGALPSLLQSILGVEWTKDYSFILLGWTTGLAGGWDYLLMSTFVFFVVTGPMLRAVLCFWASRLNETSTMSPDVAARVRRKKRRMSFWIDFIGAFCAFEVFTVAVFMVDLLMPSITDGIIHDKRCKQLQQDSDKCLFVEFDMTRTYGVVIVAGIMLLLVSRRMRNYNYYK